MKKELINRILETLQVTEEVVGKDERDLVFSQYLQDILTDYTITKTE